MSASATCCTGTIRCLPLRTLHRPANSPRRLSGAAVPAWEGSHTTGENSCTVALLDVEDVNVRFGGHHPVRDVNLAVEAGRITGLIGPNGAGKTTLFNVITGVQPPTSGRVTFDGEDISDQPTYKRARRGVARTFQRLGGFGSRTARDNILIAGPLRPPQLHAQH